MILYLRFSQLLCLILIFHSFNTLAQKTELEVIAGPAMVSTRFSSGKNSDHKMKIAPLAGVGMNYHFTNHWSIGAQLLYEAKGSSDEVTLIYYVGSSPTVIDKYKYITNLNYITLPVMARYTLGKKTQWSAGAGGYISYLIKTKQYVTSDSNPGSKESFDVTQYYNNIDAGISLAVGVTIPVGDKLRLKGSLTESIGLVKIYAPSNPVTGPSPKNNSLSLQIGVSYLLQKK